MRHTFFFLSLVIFSACQTAEEKTADRKTDLNPAITEIVAFMADSVAECKTWLSKDYRIRTFFEPSDTLADVVEDYFSHDEIMDVFDGMEDMTMMDFTAYLDDLNIAHVPELDSAQNCASAINTLAFLNK